MAWNRDEARFALRQSKFDAVLHFLSTNDDDVTTYDYFVRDLWSRLCVDERGDKNDFEGMKANPRLGMSLEGFTCKQRSEIYTGLADEL